MSNLRINVARSATFGGITGGVNEDALVLAARANLRWGSGLQGVATLGALPPALAIFHLSSYTARARQLERHKGPVLRGTLSRPGLRNGLIQIIDQGIYVDPVGHCALTNILKTRDSAADAA